MTWEKCLFFFIYIINKLQHRKCFVRIFIHSLQNFGKLTRSLRSLVRFPKFCNSWIKIRTAHFLWSNLYVSLISDRRYLVLWRSPQLFFSFADLCVFPLLFSRSFSRRFHANSIFVASALGHGGPKLAFHWSAVCPGWQPLWWGVISFQNFRSLKTRALFLRRFPCFKRINRVYRFDGLLWNLAKMFLGYQCEKGCEAFLIFQILFLLNALMCRRSANIQFANFKINFLVSQSEYRKSLTPFCSLSATDWHCAVCLVVLAIRKAGNSV